MTQTKLLGEWSGKNASKQASGIISHHVPETRRGFVERAIRQRLRVFCGECKELRSITECTGITNETETSSTYQVRLSDCEHPRSVTLAVEYVPSRKIKRGLTQDTEIPETKPEDIEAEAIRTEMDSAGTL